MKNVADRIPVGFWLALFAALTLFTWIDSLNWEIVAWDEETFIVLARDVLNGNLPYVHEFDNKPPGLFIALAAMMKVFGASLMTVRLFGALCGFSTTVATFLIARRLTNQTVAGVTAALVPLLNFGGVYTTAELPAAALLMTGIWLCLRFGGSLRAAALAGLCLSLATLCRSNLIVVVACLGGIYLAGTWVRWIGVNRRSIIVYVAAGLVPPLGLTAAYGFTGHLREFVEAEIVTPLSYSGSQHSPFDIAQTIIFKAARLGSDIWSRHGLLIAIALGGTAGLAALLASVARRPAFSLGASHSSAPGAPGAGAVANFTNSKGEYWRRWFLPSVQLPASGPSLSRDKIILGALMAATMVATMINGVFYLHYLDDIAPFISLALALLVRMITATAFRLAVLGLTTSAIILGGGVYGAGAAKVAFHYKEVVASYDARRAAGLIAADIRPSDHVWAVEYHLVYFYLDKRPPTPLATHPDNVLRTAILAPMSRDGFAAPNEIDKIMQSRPTYIVTDYEDPVPAYMVKLDGYTSNGAGDRFQQLLSRSYSRFARVGRIAIFRRKDVGAHTTTIASTSISAPRR